MPTPFPSLQHLSPCVSRLSHVKSAVYAVTWEDPTLADALSIQISLLNTGIPASIISMIPYIIAIIALVLSSLSTKMHRSGHYLFRRTRTETG